VVDVAKKTKAAQTKVGQTKAGQTKAGQTKAAQPKPGQTRKAGPKTKAGPVLVETELSPDELLDQIEAERSRVRDGARRAIGITGQQSGQQPLRRVMSDNGLTWYPLLALSILVIVDQFQGFAFSVLGPEISHTLGISATVLALIVTLKTLMVMVASLPMAAYVQQRPRRALFSIVTGVTWAFTTLLTGFVTSVFALGAVMIGDGASTGSVQALHTPLLLDSYPTDVRVRTLAFYQAAGSLGSVLAPLLVGLFTTLLGLTWRGVFLAMGITCVLASIVSIRLRDPGFGRWDSQKVRALVQEDLAQEAGPVATTAVPTPAEAAPPEVRPEENSLGFFEIMRRLLLIPTVRRLNAAWAVLGMLVFPLYTFFFFFLQERWHLGPGGRSVFAAAMSACALPALAWFGRNGEAAFRRDPARLVRLAALILLVVAVSAAVAVASPFFWLMAVGFGIVFGSAAVLLPALGMVLLSVVPVTTRPHASALGGLFFAGVGGIGGLLLLSGIDTRFGTSGAIGSLAVPCVIAAAILFQATRTVNDDLDRLIDEVVEDEELRTLTASGTHLPLLSCRHIDFSYGQLQVLFDVTFTIDDGEMVALLGTNGAGKSTLLRVISGLGLPTRGRVRLRGGDITYLDAERRTSMGIAQVPGGRAVFGPLTVADNLRAYGYGLGRERRAFDQRVEECFDVFPRLAERRSQAASTLSGGEQQMLALSKAFILRPQLLLIDELSLGLAPKVVSQLLEMVRRINSTGVAVVLVEQSVNIALDLVDHAYFMEKGQIRFDGRSTDLIARSDLLRSVFLAGTGTATKGVSS